MKSTRLALISPIVLLLAACGSDDNNATAPDAALIDAGVMTGVPVGSNTDTDATIGTSTGTSTTGSDDSGTTTTTNMDGSTTTTGDDGSTSGDDDGSTGTDSSTGGGTAAFAVLRVGSATETLSSTTAASAHVEFMTATGTITKTVDLPSTFGLSGGTDTEGGMTLATNGAFLTFGGYTAAAGTAFSAATRAIATVTSAGATDVTRTFAATDFPTNFRGVASDGTNFWLSGTTSPALAYYSGSTFTALTGTTPSAAHDVAIFGGQLYATTASTGAIGLNVVGSGLPTTGSQTVTIVPGVVATNAYAFVAFDEDTAVAGIDRLYVADGTAGLLKYTLATTGGVWTLSQTVSSLGGVRGVAGTVTGGTATLFVTDYSGDAANSVYKVTDTGTGAPTVSAALATSGTNQVFRGVALLPN